MKKYAYIWIGVVLVFLLLAIWCFRKTPVSTPNQPAITPNVTNYVATTSPTSNPAKNITSQSVPNLSNPTNLAEAYKAYDRGLIDKDQLRRLIITERSKQSLDFYGKVIDQYGQAVVGAKVKGDVELDPGTGYGKSETYYTETDAEGRFSFIGLHGLGLGIWPQKQGYDYDLKLPSRRPDNYQPDLNNPVFFTMWKLKGAEPMVHSQIEVGIPCDGTQRKFDLLTGHRVENGGDLTVSFSRDPVNIVRGKHFDWKLVLDVPQGGLFEITDLYPNEAPAEGYHPDVVIDMPADTNGWSSSFRESYYLESRDGKVFGRVTVHLTGDYEPPPAHFEIDAYLNPGGSHNLEIDQSRVTRVGNGNF